MKYTIIILALVYSLSASGQNEEIGWFGNESSPLFDFTLSASVPHGEFSNNTQSIGLGFAGGYYFPFASKVPLFLGIEGGYTLKGTHTEHIYQQVEIFTGNTIIDIIPIQMDLETRNNIWNMFVSLRYIAPVSMIKPYIEAKIGFNHLTTKTSLYDRTISGWLADYGDDLISTSRQISSLVLAYGGEAGFLIPLNDNTAIKMGLSYIVGGTAEYFDESQIAKWNIVYTGSNYNPNNLRSDDFEINEDAQPHKSGTNLYRIHIGVTKNLY